MQRLTLVFLSAVLLLSACETTKQVTISNSWLNKEKLKDRPVKSVYIIGLFKNPDVNAILENTLADEAKARRYVAYRNFVQFPYKIDNREDAKRLILEKVTKLGCDAIFVTAIKNEHAETRYVSTSSIAVSTGGYYPMNGNQSNFNSYYAGYYSETSLSGYYETNHLYYLESNLFDSNTHELLWSVQSKSYNPTDIEKVSKEYCNELFKLLEKEKDFKGRRIEEK